MRSQMLMVFTVLTAVATKFGHKATSLFSAAGRAKKQQVIDRTIDLFADVIADNSVYDEHAARRYLKARAAQSQTVVQGVIIVTIASVGVVIVANIDSSLGNVSNSNLSQSQEGLLTGFGSMIDLIEPLLIVLIAVVLIAVVQRIRQ